MLIFLFMFSSLHRMSNSVKYKCVIFSYYVMICYDALMRVNRDFEWRRPDRPYRDAPYPVHDAGGARAALDPERIHETHLAKSLVLPGGATWRPYQPLEDEPALFRTFAETDDIPAFANKFGHLGMDTELVPSMKRTRVERLRDWEAEISAMRQCLEAWDSYRSSKVTKLPDDWERYVHIDPWPQGIVPESEKLFAFVLHHVRPRIQAHTESTLIHDPSLKRAIPLEVVVSPKNLLGAIWLQFALALEENPKQRKCEICGRWFTVSPRGNRANVAYCSTRCRSAAYRLAKSATELMNDGMSIDEAATELGKPENLIRRLLERRTTDSNDIDGEEG